MSCTCFQTSRFCSLNHSPGLRARTSRLPCDSGKHLRSERPGRRRFYDNAPSSATRKPEPFQKSHRGPRRPSSETWSSYALPPRIRLRVCSRVTQKTSSLPARGPARAIGPHGGPEERQGSRVCSSVNSSFWTWPEVTAPVSGSGFFRERLGRKGARDSRCCTT